jgi:hypothetical protein
MIVILKYALDETEPDEGDENYLELDCIYDDRKIIPAQEETDLADKTIYPERDGHYKSLSIYLNPEQVEDHLEFLQNMLGAQSIWALTPEGNFIDGENSVLCSIEDREYPLKFLDLAETPLTFKSCKVFASVVPT